MAFVVFSNISICYIVVFYWGSNITYVSKKKIRSQNFSKFWELMVHLSEVCQTKVKFDAALLPRKNCMAIKNLQKAYVKKHKNIILSKMHFEKKIRCIKTPIYVKIYSFRPWLCHKQTWTVSKIHFKSFPLKTKNPPFNPIANVADLVSYLNKM